MALIKCSECGKMVSDKAEVCPNCGNPIKGVEHQTEPETESQPQETINNQPQEKKSKRWLYVIFAILFAAVVCFGSWLYFSDDYEAEEMRDYFSQLFSDGEEGYTLPLAEVADTTSSQGVSLNEYGMGGAPCDSTVAVEDCEVTEDVEDATADGESTEDVVVATADEESSKDDRQSKDTSWILGMWQVVTCTRADMMLFGKPSRYTVYITSSRITVEFNDRIVYKGNYRIEDDCIYYGEGDNRTTIWLDTDSECLMLDPSTPMHRIHI